MRLMTGAILILASVILISLFTFMTGFEEDVIKPCTWMQYYAYAIGVIGWAFMLWGLVRDFRAARYHRRTIHKGDA
jgi:hypothetical protein